MDRLKQNCIETDIQRTKPVRHPVGRLLAGAVAVAFLTKAAAGAQTSEAVQTSAVAQTSLSADSYKPVRVADPGPRPIGNQSIMVKGAILNTGVVDTTQPKDAAGNGAGLPLANLTADQTGFWFSALAVFGETASVDGATDSSTNNPTIKGLGPGFNGNSCFMCHSFPAIGGTKIG